MLRQFFKLSVFSLMLGVVPLAACGQRLDISTVEDRIQADIERQARRLTLREVRCPSDVTPQAGGFFRCVGELDPEGTFTINVTQQDDQGTMTWDVPNSKVILNLVKVEEGIQQGLVAALGQRALVDCGEAVYRVNQPGDRFECRVVGGLTDGADTINVVLVTVDGTGNLDWQEIRDGSAMAARRASTPGISASPPGIAGAPPSVQTAAPPSPAEGSGSRPPTPSDDDPDAPKDE